MNTNITDFRIWRNPTRTETRFYCHTADGREGCYYKTGNHWHEARSYEGDLAEAEWKQAREIATWNGKLHTVYANQMADRLGEMEPAQAAEGNPESAPTTRTEPTPVVRTNRQGQHCSICGHWAEAGEGELIHLTDEEDIDFIGQGRQWIVYCLDRAGCRQRLGEAKAEAAAKTAKDAEGRAAWEALPEDEQKRLRDQAWSEFFEATQYFT